MIEELNLMPQHRDAGEITIAMAKRMDDRDDMSLRAKQSAAGYKERLDEIDGDIARLRKEFQDGQLWLIKEGIGIASAPKRIATATGKGE